jgi:hypothetical protein
MSSVTDDDDYHIFKSSNIYNTDEPNLLLYNTLSGNVKSIAKLVYYHSIQELFVYTKNKKWYHLHEGCWLEDMGRMRVCLVIELTLEHVYKLLVKYYKSIKNKSEKMKVAEKILKKSKSSGFINSIVRELKEIYVEEDVLSEERFRGVAFT